jgi:protein SCO1/2
MRSPKSLLVALGLCALPLLSLGQTQSSLTSQMGITQNLGAKVPTDATFVDETNHKVTFGSYLGKRPVILIPIFYACQTGCPLITDGLVQTLHAAAHPTGMLAMNKSADHPLALGRDLEVVMVSIDPRETPELAANKKAFIMDHLGDPQGFDHWHMLTGTMPNIRKLTDAVGFKFYFNPAINVIRHATGTVIISPNGTISSYTIGNEFPTKFLESDLAIAARNEVGQKADQSFMFGCVILDPATGKIRFVVENIVRVACVLFLIFMSLGIYVMLRNERRAASAAGGRLSGV